ncbi:uncharacterized protein E0L32_005001 [Thyridium curvatum]|uniref:Uncharacterized protein n=1 Tax=Thyridium curvatum TaxID=1093900 RepID=A0A507AY43_9PEZI|nr:uncharacterized protein E0L32_005001 [Thyridium curvatum]TPX14892.1 hypothetical protein E0L32_005001 [Thyridium curvatum]
MATPEQETSLAQQARSLNTNSLVLETLLPNVKPHSQDEDNYDRPWMCDFANQMGEYLENGFAERVNAGLELLTHEGRFVHDYESDPAKAAPDMPPFLEQVLLDLDDVIARGPQTKFGGEKTKWGTIPERHEPYHWARWLVETAEDVIDRTAIGDVIKVEKAYHTTRQVRDLIKIPPVYRCFCGELEAIISRTGHYTAIASDFTREHHRTGPLTYRTTGSNGEHVTLLRSELLIGFTLLLCQLARWDSCEWDDLSSSNKRFWREREIFDYNCERGQLVCRDQLPETVHVTVITEIWNAVRVVQFACRTDIDEADDKFSICVRPVAALPSLPPTATGAGISNDAGVTKSKLPSADGPPPTYMEQKLDLLRWALWPVNPPLPPAAKGKGCMMEKLDLLRWALRAENPPLPPAAKGKGCNNDLSSTSSNDPSSTAAVRIPSQTSDSSTLFSFSTEEPPLTPLTPAMSLQPSPDSSLELDLPVRQCAREGEQSKNE